MERDMAKDLAELWGKFSLTEEDGDVAEITAKGKQCLVGKLISERVVGKESIRSTLCRGWKPTGSLSFKVEGENTFVIEFEHVWDKIRVMEGRPWIFERQLFTVAEYDGITPPHKMNFESEAFWVRMHHLPLSCMGGRWVTSWVQLWAWWKMWILMKMGSAWESF